MKVQLSIHITVYGSGDGEDDYYKFEITDTMLSASNNSVLTIFDIDNGYKSGDEKIWASSIST